MFFKTLLILGLLLPLTSQAQKKVSFNLTKKESCLLICDTAFRTCMNKKVGSRKSRRVKKNDLRNSSLAVPLKSAKKSRFRDFYANRKSSLGANFAQKSRN